MCDSLCVDILTTNKNVKVRHLIPPVGNKKLDISPFPFASGKQTNKKVINILLKTRLDRLFGNFITQECFFQWLSCHL